MKYDLQKASLTKRISAFLFDFILWAMLIMGIALLLSAIFGYDSYNKTLDACYERYEKEYGVTLDISMEAYNKLTQEQLKAYEAANAALAKDTEAVYAYNMIINLTLVIGTLSILGAYLVLEFGVPLWFGNGQTLGKKIFSIAVMRTDGVKLAPLALFIRTVLGKFTVETMIPLLIVVMIVFGGLGLMGTIILGLILLLQVILMVTSGTNAMIHDKWANTVVVDMASQMIFGSELELIAYKEKAQAEKAARQDY